MRLHRAAFVVVDKEYAARQVVRHYLTEVGTSYAQEFTAAVAGSNDVFPWDIYVADSGAQAVHVDPDCVAVRERNPNSPFSDDQTDLIDDAKPNGTVIK